MNIPSSSYVLLSVTRSKLLGCVADFFRGVVPSDSFGYHAGKFLLRHSGVVVAALMDLGGAVALVTFYTMTFRWPALRCGGSFPAHACAFRTHVQSSH